MAYEREARVLTDAVRAAGAVIKEYFVKGAEVYTKTDNSPVTEADLAANAVLVERLRDAFPEDAILTEEAPPHESVTTVPRCWIIDPLDGTAHFVRREPTFAVMVALEEGGRPTVGAIYYPMSDELYAAIVGAGATVTREGETAPLLFTAVPFATARIGTTPRSFRTLTTGSPHWMGDPNRLVHTGPGFGFRPQALEKTFDAYIGWLADPNAGGYPWDLCATDLIIHEAGGVLTKISGEHYTYRRAHERLQGGILAARDAALHAQVRGMLDVTSNE